MKEAQFAPVLEVGTLTLDRFGLWQKNGDWKFSPPMYSMKHGGMQVFSDWPADELLAMSVQNDQISALPTLDVTDDSQDR